MVTLGSRSLGRCTTSAADAWLAEQLPRLRATVEAGGPPDSIAARVADRLSGHLPGVGILTAEQLAGSPETYQQHLLFASAGLSLTALVWRPGQQTSVHDHICWCTVAVLQGVEHEVRYNLDIDADGRPGLREGRHVFSEPGTISSFAPPGDIHRVRNTGDGNAVSLHVYGADIAATGTSVLRTYAV